MDLYRVIFTDLTCQRCDARHRANVQFETGKDRLEQYQAGDVLAEAAGFAVDRAYEGIADRYCDPCMRRFLGEREQAAAVILAAFAEAGRLEVKLPNGRATLAPSAILLLGAQKSEEARGDGRYTSPPRMLEGLGFRWGQEAWVTTAGMYSSGLLKALKQGLGEAMRRLGWPHGDDPWREDLTVWVDGERRIDVRVN